MLVPSYGPFLPFILLALLELALPLVLFQQGCRGRSVRRALCYTGALTVFPILMHYHFRGARTAYWDLSWLITDAILVGISLALYGAGRLARIGWRRLRA